MTDRGRMIVIMHDRADLPSLPTSLPAYLEVMGDIACLAWGKGLRVGGKHLIFA